VPSFWAVTNLPPRRCCTIWKSLSARRIVWSLGCVSMNVVVP